MDQRGVHPDEAIREGKLQLSNASPGFIFSLALSLTPCLLSSSFSLSYTPPLPGGEGWIKNVPGFIFDSPSSPHPFFLLIYLHLSSAPVPQCCPPSSPTQRNTVAQVLGSNVGKLEEWIERSELDSLFGGSRHSHNLDWLLGGGGGGGGGVVRQ